MATRRIPNRDKRTPERFDMIVACLRAGNTRRQAAAFVEISPETFYRWLDQEPGFRERCEKAEAEHEARMLDRVVKAAVSGDAWQAAAWWLERRRRDEYGKAEKVELTGRDGGPIETADVTGTLTDADLREALRTAERIASAGRASEEASGSTEG